MEFDVYYVDAFADKVFAGNPAAVIFTDIDDDKLMQKIAYQFSKKIKILFKFLL